jgi:hypothetical protein
MREDMPQAKAVASAAWRMLKAKEKESVLLKQRFSAFRCRAETWACTWRSEEMTEPWSRCFRERWSDAIM